MPIARAMPSSVAPLRREHHEDQEDQEDAGRDREAAERREHRDEDVGLIVGQLEPVALDVLQVEALCGDRRTGRGEHVRGVRRAAGRVPAVGHEEPADLALVADERLRAPQRQQHGCIVGAGAVVVDDRSDAEPCLADPGEDAQAIADTRAERGGPVPVEVDLARARGRRATGARRCRRDLVHAAHGGRIGARRATPAPPSGACVRSCTATGSTTAGVTPSTRPVRRNARSAAGTCAASR